VLLGRETPLRQSRHLYGCHTVSTWLAFFSLPRSASVTGQIRLPDHARSGVIWITGYSGAGKTSVARHVERLLREQGAPVIRLDGDDLRRIFAGRWGHERADRVELGRVYFRLCSHLAAQGLVVVIGAVAMYDDVRQFVRTNIPRSMEVYLDVPHDVRVARDEGTKQVYKSMTDLEQMYDVPASPDLWIDNFGETTPGDAAQQVVDAYLNRNDNVEPDRGKSQHWESYYGTTVGSLEPSPFALAVAEFLGDTVDVIEVGCGNGRDSAYIESLGHRVVAIDASHAAVNLARRVHRGTRVEFHAGVLAEFASDWTKSFDILYSRFVIHAMTELEELALLRDAHEVLRPGGLLLIECRSINDPLAREGEVLSPTERVAGHYRRFIVLEDFLDRLAAEGFTVEQYVEAQGLAPHGHEDPVVIRVFCRNG
jgi:bifunctional enzyme CysN/CysC